MYITKEEISETFADQVAELCYKRYADLPKTGKPNEPREWTLLAGVVMVLRNPYGGSDLSEQSKVVALGTGTKCLGQTKMSPQGNLINDSHAEIMARRGFIRYLYHQVLLTYQNGTSEVFDRFECGKCVLHKDITFHFFTSHTPCGDASIIPMTIPDDEDIGNCVYGSSGNTKHNESKSVIISTTNCITKFSEDNCIHNKLKERCNRKYNDASDVNQAKRPRIEVIESDISMQKIPKENNQSSASDIHRTGAKCLTTEMLQDPHLPGAAYHVEGALRTKPGRGDPTLSLSCSDKLARWNVVGVQGALLAFLLDWPIYFSSVIIGGGCAFSETALKRATMDRLTSKLGTTGVEDALPEPEFNLPRHYTVNNPKFMQASKPFVHAQTAGKQPCPSSIVWCAVPERSLEVAVEGRKQGATKKAACTPKGRLAICKKEFLKTFINIVKKMPNCSACISNILHSKTVTENENEVLEHLSDLTYMSMKNISKDYQKAWNTVKEKCFPAWVNKPDSYLMFKVAD